MELKVKINIIDDEGKSVMGPGILQLLANIREYGSINRAAKKMNLSYVKALKLLSNMEAKIGKTILVKRSGGIDGGGTDLTPLGVKLLEEFGKLRRRVDVYAEDEFSRFLKGIEHEA